jgi:hypothetical protein
MVNVILNQNYFQYDGKYFKATKGVTIASLISGFIAELYLQHFEESSIRHWLESREILYYRRYADAVLIIFYQTKTNEWAISMYMNIVHKHLEFKVKGEESKNIKYLDLSIYRHNSLPIGIYRKSTQIDTTIYCISNHPMQHKLVTYIFTHMGC